MVLDRVQNQFNGGISRFLGLNGGIIGVGGKRGLKWISQVRVKVKI